MGHSPHEQEVVIADLPGLIEGAHEGKGLGTRFLKHVERTRILLHFLDLSHEGAEDPAESYSIIRRELELYDPELMEKPERVVGTKLDAADPLRVEKFLEFVREKGFPELMISSQTGEGMPRLMEELAVVLAEEERLEEERKRVDVSGDEPRVVPPGNVPEERNPSSVIA
jgi:GTP-binding protein